jgi:hypothetical protein
MQRMQQAAFYWTPAPGSLLTLRHRMPLQRTRLKDISRFQLVFWFLTPIGFAPFNGHSNPDQSVVCSSPTAYSVSTTFSTTPEPDCWIVQ